jgi:hypothetical protein
MRRKGIRCKYSWYETLTCDSLMAAKIPHLLQQQEITFILTLGLISGQEEEEEKVRDYDLQAFL